MWRVIEAGWAGLAMENPGERKEEKKSGKEGEREKKIELKMRGQRGILYWKLEWKSQKKG
ncbi:hypothetical protein COLO4_16647 [Corchorus olitorius]|uniref:Uncharacterized protein n=1 Tax=Corchorus olitorius TaxID=93759 RepID=A0A1R3JG86_9ROSI|nr:hypothetical protein COLO4_16647 [Corchorus olitorius]